MAREKGVTYLSQGMHFTIRRIAELTGFDPTLLRAWERRYGLLRPSRLENGYRRYTNEDVTVLARVRALLNEGHAIGDIARMSRKELLREDRRERVPTPERTPALLGAPGAHVDDARPELGWAVLDALPCAVIVTDAAGLVWWVSRGVPALCGYDLAELNGRSPGHLLQGPRTEPAAIARLREGIAHRRRVSTRITNYHKNGDTYLAQLDVTPLFVGPEHVGFVGMVQRATARA